ncbi:TetR/AcrR family transcriptional regulator [Henriciella litoralis]|uniref:TetR/AcrR family transcriptional regulator n=1 Tax=Henriciella litoralis TaxID=568102 RepID=UPI000A04B85C|nr:TetR/AcrR family transcriptional regulator [Henriciella litoralis]
MQNDDPLLTGARKRRTARVDQVLNAAADCFVEWGFHGASMSKIAKRAKMSAGHIYHYFENKEAIIAAIVDRDSEEAAARFEELKAVPRQEVVAEMIARVEEMVHTKSDAFQSALNLEILAECKRNPQIAAIVRKHDEQIREMFNDIIDDKLGLPNPDGRAELLLCMFGGLGMRMLQNPSLDPATLVPMFRYIMQTALSESPSPDA